MDEETELVKETDRIFIIKITINNVVHTVVNCYEPNTRIEKDQLSTSTSRGTTRYRNGQCMGSRGLKHCSGTSRQYRRPSSPQKRDSNIQRYVST